MPPGPPPLPRRLGGRLCVDFVNTVEERASVRPQELLVSPARLVDWGLDAGALRARPHEAPDSTLLARARALRESFRLVVLGEADDDDLRRVNAAIAEAGSHSIVHAAADGYAWGWSEDCPDTVLWAVARDMAELLTDHAALARVRTCALETCGWLFVDHSRNGSRRWCSMEGCGNIAKSRAFQARQRGRRD